MRLGKDKVQIIRTHSRKNYKDTIKENYKDTIKEEVRGHIPGKHYKDTIRGCSHITSAAGGGGRGYGHSSY